MKTLSTVLAGSMLLSLAACGGKAGQEIHDALNGKPKEAQALTAFTSGIWKSGCVSTGVIPKALDIPFKAYQTVYIVHSDATSSLQRTTTYFSDTDCKQSDASMIIDESMRFTFGDVTNGDNYAYNTIVKNVTAQPVSDEAVNSMNKLTGYCNINNWTKGTTATDVGAAAGQPTCLGTEALNVTRYGVIQVTGPANSEIYFNEGVLIEAARPQTADTNSPKYTR